MAMAIGDSVIHSFHCKRRRGAYVGAAKAAEKSGDKAKAREYYKKVVAIAGGADQDRTEVADARAYLKKR